MDKKEQLTDGESPRKSPKDILANLKAYYNNDEIIESITLRVNFTNNKTFFKSLKAFLNDFEDVHVIEMLFHSSIAEIEDEMDLYKRAEQSIIKTIDRPVFLINDDQIDISKTTPWKRHIDEYMDSISRVIPAVGRIEVIGDKRWPMVGTGWLIRDTDIVVTNRHVAKHFASKNDEGEFEIRKSHRRRPLGIKIDFKEEHDTNDELEFRVKEVIHITKNSELDIALLRVATINHNGHKLPLGLELSNNPPTLKEDIYVVGYPACSQNEELRTAYFNSMSGAKQFAPGAFFRTHISDYIYKHDCTTWNGNSGSPLIDFKTGEVLGVHYAGTSEKVAEFRANYAVSVKFLIELLKKLGVKYNYSVHPDKK